MARGLILMLVAAAGLAQGQLADPTRPAVAPVQAVEAAAAEPAPAGLQSVILRKGAKPAALINGEVIELGGQVGEAKLVKVNEDSVVLKGPGGEEILRLMPAAEKKIKKVGFRDTAKKTKRTEK